jgi:CRP-like cAMP-binding protein
VPASNGRPRPGENGLLAALPATDYRRLLRALEPIFLAFDDTLYEPEEPIRSVYFPRGGIVSLLLVMGNGFAVEVGRVSSEGMIGLPVFLGVERSHVRASVQMPGQALRMTRQAFQKEVNRGGALSDLLRRYTQTFLGHVSQVSACNTLHSVEQRLCRWLLVTHDRVRADQFAVTQEFLAGVLGVHRPSVTLAARSLQKAGLIRYSRGKLRILDRHGLEEASCECYRAIRRQFDQLLTEIGG